MPRDDSSATGDTSSPIYMRWFAGCLPPVRGTAKGQQEKLESVVSLPYNRLEETRFDSPATYGSIESETKCAHGVIYRYCTRDHDDGADVDPGEHCHLDLPTLTDKNARKRLIVASVLCLFFMVLEIVGGFLSRSLAVATDAAHLLTDFASFMISLFSIWLSKRPATKQLSFGWHRAEVIGAMTSVLMIWVITGVIVYMAAERLATGQYDVQPTIMLITSGVGILVNIILGLTLHQHDSHGGHKHDSHGGHKHGNEDPEASCGGRESDGDAAEHATPGVSVHGVSRSASHHIPKRNINVSAALIHVVGDFIQSVGVFVAALIIYFKPEYQFVDPLCTFLFSVLVLVTTYAIMKNVLNVLMEGIPRGIRFDEVEKLLLSIDGVVKIHNLHVWCLSLERMAMAAHVVILPGHSHQSILKEAIARLGRKYKFFVTTLQIEEFKDSMIDCGLCNEKPKD